MLYEKLNITSPAAQIILSVAIIMLSGFLMTRITKKLRLPNVTAYLITGILLGPFCFNAIPQSFIGGTEFLSDIALAFISFGTGEFFKFAALKKNGAKVIVITLFEACLAFLLTFFVLFAVLKVEFAFSIVLSALAAATAPASTLMTIRQTRAKGDFVDTLLQVIALDNVISLFAYSIAISLAVAAATSAAIMPASIVLPVVKNIGALLLGGLFGGVMCLLIRKKRSDDNRLIIAVALLFAFCGICTVMDISPLLGCMSMGMIYSNMSKDDKLFKQLNYFNPPFMLMFFVRSGLSFDISALLDSGAGFGGVSLLVIGILYFAIRMIGKYAGAFIGSTIVRKSASVRKYLGLALIPQAGVSIGLATIGARTLGGELGNALLTVVLASGIMYELVGPVCAKLSLYLSGSYSNKLEDIVTVEEQGGKTSLELLIERIHKIQEEIPDPINEDEHAFLEAAEEHYAAVMRSHVRTPQNRRRL